MSWFRGDFKQKRNFKNCKELKIIPDVNSKLNTINTTEFLWYFGKPNYKNNG
jgi:hypothetical protein